MNQPDFLMTDNLVPWAWGAGNDVWATLQSAMQGDVAGLADLATKEPNLVRCSVHYRTPLHFAIRENQPEATRFLIEQGAEIPYATGKGAMDNAPVMASDRGYDMMFGLLTEYLAEHHDIRPEGNEVAAAIRNQSSRESRQVVTRIGVDVADERGNKALHWAVMTRQMDLIDFCLEAGADINAIRPDGARPLDLTNGDYYYRGWRDTHPDGEPDHWTVMDHLLAKGADYDLTTACRRGDIDRVREILKGDPHVANRDALYNTWYSGFPLRSAAKAGHIEIVRLLLAHGADPNKPEHGLAPFGGCVYDATQNGHFDVVKLLLESGANPNQEVESSGCPLSVVTDDRTRDLLRKHGAINDPFGCCYYGHVDDFAIQCERNPEIANDSHLFVLAAERNKDLVDIFLQYQPDLWQRMPATLGESREMTDWMIQNGMNPNQADWLGIHPLHRGCSEEDFATWRELGADINMIDGEHKSTPLGWAARSGKLEYAELLLKHGADPDLAGADWARPIEWAKRRGHSAVAAIV